MKIWLRYFIELFRFPMVKLALIKRFPTCQFYDGAIVNEYSRLGNYNVIFEKTAILNSIIGSHTYIQKNSTVLNCDIGKFCSIAANVNIGLGRHPLDRVSTHPAFYSISQPLALTFATIDSYNPFERVFIGNDVWIGKGATIMDGVRIGNGAVIAAQAVVTADVEPYAIVAGVPAKIIRYRFDEEIRNALEQSKWWENTDDWLKENSLYFLTPSEFLKRVT